MKLNFKRAGLSQLTATSFSLDGRSRKTLYRVILLWMTSFPRPSSIKCTTSSAGLPRNWRGLLHRPPTALRWDRDAGCGWETESVTAEDDLHVAVLDNEPLPSCLELPERSVHWRRFKGLRCCLVRLNHRPCCCFLVLFVEIEQLFY